MSFCKCVYINDHSYAHHTATKIFPFPHSSRGLWYQTSQGVKRPVREDYQRYDTYNTWSFTSTPTSPIYLQGVVLLRPPLHNKGLVFPLILSILVMGEAALAKIKGEELPWGLSSTAAAAAVLSQGWVIRSKQVRNYEIFTHYHQSGPSMRTVTRLLSTWFGENSTRFVTEFDAYPFRNHLKKWSTADRCN